MNERPNPKYSMKNYFNADEGNDCLDLWGNELTEYYLSACEKIRGTVCPPVKIYGVLFVRVFKSTGYYLSACAKMTGYYLSGVLFVQYPCN